MPTSRIKKIGLIFFVFAILLGGIFIWQKNTNSSVRLTSAQRLPDISSRLNPSSAQAVNSQNARNNIQYVVLSFDGSYSLQKWRETLDFSRQMTAIGHPVHFTYFVSGVYFLSSAHRTVYLPPGRPAGSSAIGFGYSAADVKERVALVNRALSEGHEIGSHLNGHFNGASWNKAAWQQEFAEFKKLLFNIAENNGVTEKPNQVQVEDAQSYRLNLSPEDIIGFRAPELGRNSAMHEVLAENGYKYDASSIGQLDEMPVLHSNGLWEFPLTRIKFDNRKLEILSMDYNFYFKQSGAVDAVKKDSPAWQEFYSQVYVSYLNYFNHSYYGNRAPIFIASHFSNWNDGVYWQAMKNLATDVCGKVDVKCVTYRQLMADLKTE